MEDPAEARRCAGTVGHSRSRAWALAFAPTLIHAGTGHVDSDGALWDDVRVRSLRPIAEPSPAATAEGDSLLELKQHRWRLRCRKAGANAE